MIRLTARAESWPIAGRFVIARGAKTEARVVVVEIARDGAVGRGEGTPYPRYGETVEATLAEIEAVRSSVEAGLGRMALQSSMPPGAARNAVDCALWDLEAKLSGVRAATTAGIGPLEPLTTAYTLSLAPPDEMAAAARAAAHRPVLKLKIGGADDLAAVEAVRAAAPEARLIVDANESLSFDDLRRTAAGFAALGVELLEQPLKAGEDEPLEGWASPVTLCADESLHTRAELAACARRYRCLNIKLDKTGGLTEALALRAEARALALEIMAGCMVATSLAMAPALLIGQGAAWVDLDGPLLLAKDRSPGLVFEGSTIAPPSPELWG